MASINNTPIVTLAEGRPVQDPSAATILRGGQGSRGGLALLEDTQLIETLAHFPRERIPERAVHAKAAGAWGEFECTHDVSDLTTAAFLSEVGKKTKVLARLSLVTGESGSADTARDVRGFALKLFTEEGNWDFVGNDVPVFFIRDPAKFPSLNRSHKRHPRTHAPDATMFWDFHSRNQEGVHCLMQLFGARGVPASLRRMSGYGNHTYKFGRPEDGSFKYVKIHFKPDAGVQTLSQAEATRLAGTEPDFHIKDLYNAIERGDFPTWTMYLQVMDPKEAETYRWNIFDITRVWPHKDYPLRPVGRLTLNRNPANYFEEIEQAAFSPGTMVPGIGPSADIMLHARMFAYPDAARYRVGPNYQQLPGNRALHVHCPYQRDGPMRFDGNYGADPGYVRSSSSSSVRLGSPDVTHDEWIGRVTTYASAVTDEDFAQPRELWRIYKRNGEDRSFAANVAGHLGEALPEVQEAAVAMFGRVDKEVGDAIRDALREVRKDGGAGVEHVSVPTA